MEDEAGCRGHDRAPMVVASGQRIDITRDDLGHPDDPGLWDRLYQRCKVGVLVCADCADTSPSRHLYLRVQSGRRQVCAYTPEAVRAHYATESQEHHALKDKIVYLAERQGLTAEQEEVGPGGRRKTDVVVHGGVHPVGWEVQLSPITPDKLRQRLRTAVADGLVSSWLTMRSSAAFSTIIDRSPACTTRDLSTLDIATSDDLKVFQGLKRLEIVRCTEQRTKSWHRRLVCSGYHARPVGLGEHSHPSLAAMVTMSAAGDVVPIEWPRKLDLGYNRPWMWTYAADAKEFYEVERPYLERVGLTPLVPEESAPGLSAGWHVAPMQPDAPVRSWQGQAGAGLAAILGDQCPRCGWTRNKHRWDCSTGLSEIARPVFR